ncbi:MAG: M20/M25/M40 family metallo-hydrolase [Clostridia bacterium]|nr:M20/M25/M40 family metallo-hydrolase [Clostridia bacterium]
MRNEELLIKLCDELGVAGYETKVRKICEEECAPYADEMTVDAIGNLIVLKKGTGGENSKKIMFAAHTDQIGFMVKKIDQSGLIRVCNMGWNWTGSAYNEKVVFRNGTIGVVGCEGAIEDARNNPDKLFIDIGATSYDEAREYVNIGDVCGYFGPYFHLVGDRIACKSLDDRLGCYQLIEALKENDGTFPNDVYYVFTVQEELGCRGSKVTAERIHPDYGIAVDVSPAHDVPCDLIGANTVGAGIGVKISDPSVVCDEELVEIMENECRANGIKWQREVIDKGGTDASSMNLSGTGVKAGGISTVLRYPHSQSAVCSTSDIEGGIDLITAVSKHRF